MTFHFLSHMVEEVRRFDDMSVLDASLYKLFIVYIKMMY